LIIVYRGTNIQVLDLTNGCQEKIRFENKKQITSAALVSDDMAKANLVLGDIGGWITVYNPYLDFKFSYYMIVHPDNSSINSIVLFDKIFDGETKGIITTSSKNGKIIFWKYKKRPDKPKNH